MNCKLTRKALLSQSSRFSYRKGALNSFCSSTYSYSSSGTATDTSIPLQAYSPKLSSDEVLERFKSRRKRTTEFQIDISNLSTGMRDMVDVDVDDNNNNKNLDPELFLATKEVMSPLAKQLLSYIKVKGPITLHDYMAQCLNDPQFGYYQLHKSKIGETGDFITSPEVSQLFGEMIAVWLISSWEKLGPSSPSEIDIIELGPGKGTLMADIIRSTAKFHSFRKAMRIHMVELSDYMKSVQIETLKAVKHEDIDNSEYDGKTHIKTYLIDDEIPIAWYTALHDVPMHSLRPSLIVGQEFLDVFPVHQFVYTTDGWRESLVDIDTSPDCKHYFKIVLSPNETPAIGAILGFGSSPPGSNNLPTVLSTAIATGEVGEAIEVSPMALSICEDIAMRIRKHKGAALLIDYGNDFTQADTLRAFKQHRQVNVLSEPGQVDMTADVDFASCGRVATRRGAAVLGPATQAQFLVNMGILDRIQRLVELPSTTEEEASMLVQSFKKLVGEGSEEMGKRFKVMAITDGDTDIPGF